MSIRDRWINFLYRAAKGTRKTRMLLTPVGFILFGVFTGLFVALAMLTDRWLSLAWPLPGGPSWFIAVLLLIVGTRRYGMVSAPFPQGEGDAGSVQPTA